MPYLSLASPGLGSPDTLHPAARQRLAARRSSRDPFVELDDVSFGYQPGRTILAGLSLRLPRGKVTTIMGGSGCGKTTLLRLIGGVHAPLSGRVLVDGEAVDTRDAARLQRQRRRMGVLFQFGALFTDLDVFENVAFPIREHTDLPAALVRDLVLMKLNAVGLRGAAGLRIAELSGGMARRVALARAIALDPELIMYDEPFAGLDIVSMGATARLIRTLNDATGASSLLVSHDVPESLGISDYVVLLGTQGRVVAQGTPDELLASAEPETRQFLHGGADGPVRFHYPAPTLASDFGLPE